MMDDSKFKPGKEKIGHKLNQVLKRLMTECEIDDAKLAKATNVPLTTIARMRACTSANPTASSLRPLSNYFGISISQLLGDEPLPAERTLGIAGTTQPITTRIPLISWKQASHWAHSKSLPKHEITRWISTDASSSPASYALKIESNAYGDQFRPGTLLIIDPAIPPSSTNLVIMKKENEDTALLKEILIDGNDIYLKSVNPELTLTHPLEENYQYCGVVMESRYTHYEYHPSKIAYAAKQLVETHSKPVAETV